MPIDIHETKTFCAKITLRGEYEQKIEHLDALGRTDAISQMHAKYPGCEVHDVWQTPRTLGGLRL